MRYALVQPLSYRGGEGLVVSGSSAFSSKDATSVALSPGGRSGWGAVLLCALVLYFLTLAPDLTWQDQGDYQYQAAKCNLNRPGDVVRVHPLFIVSSHLAGRLGLWSYARAASIVSAIFTAVTVANVYLLVYWLCGRVWPAVLSASTFAMAHSVWFLGVQAQTYSMANAALSGGLLLVLAYLATRRLGLLYLMGLVFGLGISAHMMSQVGFAVIMVWLAAKCARREISIRSIAAVILSWAIGAFLLWVVMVIEYRRSGDMAGTVASAIWGEWGGAVFNVGRWGILLKKSVLFFVLNFPTPLVLLAIPGVWFSFRRLKSRTVARLFIVCTVAYALFAVRYDVPNQNNFFLPMYMFVSIYIGLGFAFLMKKNLLLRRVVTGLLLIAIPPTYLGLSGYARANDIALGTRRHVPYRDVYEYYLLPWQHGQAGPRRLVNEVFEKVPWGAVLLLDTTLAPAFRYAHEIESQRSDISVFRFHEIKESWRDVMRNGRRLFAFSDVEGYYPLWVESKQWLKPFAVSDSECIFEIVVPSSKRTQEGML